MPTTLERWTASEELSIGSRDGGPQAYTFHGRLWLDVDASEDIYALLWFEKTVRVFSPGGRHLRNIGRAGAGPGEFRSPFPMTLDGDSLLVVLDQLLGRMSFFELTGKLKETVSLVVGIWRDGVAREMEALGEGEYLLEVFRGFSLPRRPGEDRLHLVRLSREGSVLDTLVSVSEGTFVPAYDERRYPVIFRRPFAARPSWDVGPGGNVVFGLGDEGEIRLYTPDGAVLRRLDWSQHRRAVTPADVEAFKAQFPRGEGLDSLTSADRRLAVQVLDELEFPDHWPAFDRLVFDDAGRLWIRSPPAYGASEAHWDILDQAGAPIATIELPAELHVELVRAGAVYGLTSDEFDVPYIKRFRVDTTGGR